MALTPVPARRSPLFTFDLNSQAGDVAWAPYSRSSNIPYYTFATVHFMNKHQTIQPFLS